jgi:hypothetical protein
MKKIAIALWVFVSLCSCQKELSFDTLPPISDTSSGTPHVPNNFLVKTSVIQGEESNYYYDSKDRVTSIVSASGNKSVFQYNSNNTCTIDNFIGSSLTGHELYFINSYGFVDSFVKYGKDTTAARYIFDANKLPITKKEYKIVSSRSNLVNTITIEYNSEFNTTRVHDVFNNELTYDYYNNYPNSLNMGFVYLFKNRNLVKTTTIKARVFTGVLSHTYTFDSLNRITSETITNSNTGESEIKKYGY